MSRRLVLGLLAIAAVIALSIIWPRERATAPAPVANRDQPVAPAVPQPVTTAAPDAPAASTPSPASAPAVAGSAPQTVPPAAPGVVPPPTAPPEPEAAPAPERPGSVEADLENVQFAIRDFRTVLKENPVGNNAEITKALLGDNLKQVKVPLPNGSSINGEGELCDRWGTPYFFHQLSKTSMEVRSAGPDRQMWTSDDREAK